MEIRNLEISDKDYQTFELIFNNAILIEARDKLAIIISDCDHSLRKYLGANYDELITKAQVIIEKYKPIFNKYKLIYNTLIIARNYWSFIYWLIYKQDCSGNERLSRYMPLGEKSEYHYQYFEQHWLKPNKMVYEIR